MFMGAKGDPFSSPTPSPFLQGETSCSTSNSGDCPSAPVSPFREGWGRRANLNANSQRQKNQWGKGRVGREGGREGRRGRHHWNGKDLLLPPSPPTLSAPKIEFHQRRRRDKDRKEEEQKDDPILLEASSFLVPAKNSSSVALPNKGYLTCTYYIAQKGTNKYFADFGSPCLPDFDFEYQHFPLLLVSSSILLSSPKNHSFLLLPRLTLLLPSAAKKVVSLVLRNEDFCFRRPYLAFPPPPSFPIFNFSHPVSKIHPRSSSSSSSSSSTSFAGFHRSEERREDFLPSPFFARLVPRKNDVKDNRGIRTLTPMRKFSVSHKNR